MSDDDSLVIGPCYNCREARKLDDYLLGLKKKNYCDYRGEFKHWAWRIEAIYKQCPGHPWCEYPDEMKVRRAT